ncbi:MAG: hypothetical protein Q8936_02305 [Bacillota bacterium]|nr:hypothetical protein [Bacillota bacterium]
MEDLFKQFSDEYTLYVNKQIYSEDGPRKVNNPVLFVFIGDKTIDASKAIYEDVNKNWDNNGGIIFLNIFSKEVLQGENRVNFNIGYKEDGSKNLRRNISESFYNNEELLKKLNEAVVSVKNNILNSGRMFPSFERINISVITGADDPLNILIPEITLLIKTKLSQHFRMVFADLYTLLQEKSEGDSFLSAAYAVSFFKELEYIQSPKFCFDKPIEVFGSDKKLSVINDNKPLFELVYILSDTNEKGVIPNNSLEDNYQIISYINLLKNRNINIDTYDTENQYYDNTRFKRNISGEDEGLILSTAGLAKVKRPNSAVAVMVLSIVFDDVMFKLQQMSKKSTEEILRVFKLDNDSLNLKVSSFIPSDKKIEDMTALMTISSDISSKRFGKITLRDVEELLYGENCSNFFIENFQQPLYNSIHEKNFYEELKNTVYESVCNNSKYGLYSAYAWTAQESREASGTIIDYIKESNKIIDTNISDLESEINEIYNMRPQMPSMLRSMFGGNNGIEEIKKQLFTEVYGRRLEILMLKGRQEILNKYEVFIINLHEEIKNQVTKLYSMEEELSSYASGLAKHQDDYIGQNIREYYTNVVKGIISKLEDTYGENFYFQDNFLGNISTLLKEDDRGSVSATGDSFIKKLSRICERYILSQQDFLKSFEEELSERANITMEQWNNKVLSKEELYRKLYNILEDNSVVKVYIMNYDVSRYIEKYFFGDYSNEFIKYALNFDRETRSYKIGYVHEKRVSGIEKLQLMGGFKLKDIIYVKNAARYYDACIANGYGFHNSNELEVYYEN